MYPYIDYIQYCEMEAEKMYPEIYYELYPHIQKICDREDQLYNPMMYPFPRKEKVETMVDEIYENYTKENMKRSPDGFGGFLRSLIGILLIRELLDRRRRRRRRRPWSWYEGY